jgi:hypothetical protein
MLTNSGRWSCFMMALLLLAAVMVLPQAAQAAIPDTGQIKCYDAEGNVMICPSPGQAFYGQDAQFKPHPQSYTKLDATGNPMPVDAALWTMVRDNVTGLIWENKTDDNTIHGKNRTFTWCDTNPATNGGNQGTCGAGTEDAATDTQAFIQALNNANYGGYNDWRIPTIKELSTLVNSSTEEAAVPAIDTTWFAHTHDGNYWSSTTYLTYVANAWLVNFYDGGIFSDIKSADGRVRAVRGAQSSSHLVDNGDGTVTDTNTSLMWRKATEQQTYTWEQALAYVATLNSNRFAGYTDWRLPNRNELHSLLDYSRSNPAIDPLLKMNTDTIPNGEYWSSTTNAKTAYFAWYVQFYQGGVTSNNKSQAHYVRPVRTAGATSLLYGSFTDAGIWQWGGSAWTRLTPDNPESIVAAGTNLYGKFANGIWQWTGSGWSLLTPDSPASMVASGTSLYGNFTGNGIWKWNGSGWTQLMPDNPDAMVAAGTNLYGKFANGIWQWTGSGWSLLTPDRPAEMVAAGTNLYGNFTGNGIWQWNGSGWSQLTPDNPDAMVAAGTNLYGKFANGVWQWTGSGWTHLTPDSPASMAAAGSNLYGTFTNNGIWQWNGSNWSQLTPDNPASMVVGE